MAYFVSCHNIQPRRRNFILKSLVVSRCEIRILRVHKFLFLLDGLIYVNHFVHAEADAVIKFQNYERYHVRVAARKFSFKQLHLAIRWLSILQNFQSFKIS